MNELRTDLAGAMIPDYVVIRGSMTEEQIEEYKRKHPAKNYIFVKRV